jgi:hypothetical protein
MKSTSDDSLASTARAARDALLRAVAVYLGSNMKGLLSKEEKELYDEAVATGVVKRDLIERTADFFKRVTRGLLRVDLVTTSEKNKFATESIINAINGNIEKTNGAWEDIIVVHCRERPRDAIQLVHKLAKSAKDSTRTLIAEGDLHSIMPEFSKQRTQYLAQEMDNDCPQIVEVVESLVDIEWDQGSFKATSEIIKAHFMRLSTTFGIQVRGRTIQAQTDDIFWLWQLLYDTGILNPRISDLREPKLYRHISPQEQPNLVSRTKWNEMQALVWEVNPVYRDFLMEIQKNRNAQIGLPPRKKSKRK